MSTTWKIAAGSLVAGLGIGGFVLGDDPATDLQPVRDVDLQSARERVSTLSSPVTVTTAPPPTAPPAAKASASPVRPAPAPVIVASASPVAPAPPPAAVASASPVQPRPAGGDASASASASAGAST